MALFSMTTDEKKAAVERLIESSSPTRSFFLVLTLSAIIAASGILLNSAPIVIGGMLVSPLLSPILAISLGITVADPQLIMRSLLVLLKSMVFTIVIALLIALFTVDRELNAEILSRSAPDLAYFVVALASGIAATFTISKEGFSEQLVGVAVAIALLPPLAVFGIAISFFDWSIAAGSILLFLVNLTGILLGSLIIFSLFRFYPAKTAVVKELKEEEKTLEEEKEVISDKE